MISSLPPLNIDRLVRDTDRWVAAARQKAVKPSLDLDRLLADTRRLLETGQVPEGIPGGAETVLVVRASGRPVTR